MENVVSHRRIFELVAGIAFIAGLGSECGSAFDCEEDSWCELDGAQGRCEASGYCRFPAPTCPKELRVPRAVTVAGYESGSLANNEIGRRLGVIQMNDTQTPSGGPVD